MLLTVTFVVFFITTCVAQSEWTRLPGSAIDISAKSRELWIISRDQQIYRWNGSDWELKPGNATRIAAALDGFTWIVDKEDYTYRWNPVHYRFDLTDFRSQQISAISRDRSK